MEGGAPRGGYKIWGSSKLFWANFSGVLSLESPAQDQSTDTLLIEETSDCMTCLRPVRKSESRRVNAREQQTPSILNYSAILMYTMEAFK